MDDDLDWNDYFYINEDVLYHKTSRGNVSACSKAGSPNNIGSE